MFVILKNTFGVFFYNAKTNTHKHISSKNTLYLFFDVLFHLDRNNRGGLVLRQGGEQDTTVIENTGEFEYFLENRIRNYLYINRRPAP